MSFALFVPGAQNFTPDALRAVGLDVLVQENSQTLECQYTHHGPGGAAGNLYYFSRGQEPCALPRGNPAALEWTPAIACPRDPQQLPAGRFLMGRLPGVTITPRSLARPRLLESKSVVLADGQEWQLPRFLALPKRWHRGSNGLLKSGVDPAYQDYFDACWKFHEAARHWGDLAHDCTAEDAWAVTVRGLAMNYMLCDELVEWLGLLATDEALLTAPLAAIEIYGLAELLVQKHGRYSRKALEAMAWACGRAPDGYEPDLADLHALAEMQTKN